MNTPFGRWSWFWVIVAIIVLLLILAYCGHFHGSLAI
jgi:hypothetical protein